MKKSQCHEIIEYAITICDSDLNIVNLTINVKAKAHTCENSLLTHRYIHISRLSKIKEEDELSICVRKHK